MCFSFLEKYEFLLFDLRGSVDYSSSYKSWLDRNNVIAQKMGATWSSFAHEMPVSGYFMALRRDVFAH